ncbi:hypothetical protein D3A96_15250 [Robertkochia marina]|nr:hypothetical protein D3A96_15250 [Robertkochia marina]
MIPTDLSSGSLKIAEESFKIFPDEILNIVFVFPYRLPGSATELYWYSPSKIINEYTDQDFHQMKDELVRNHYPNISTISVEIFTGINSRAFNNFRSHHQIESAIVPQKGFLDFSKIDTYDPRKLIFKTIPNVHEISITKDSIAPQSIHQQNSGILSLIKRVLRN